jgi:hypothetical protein
MSVSELMISSVVGLARRIDRYVADEKVFSDADDIDTLDVATGAADIAS